MKYITKWSWLKKLLTWLQIDIGKATLIMDDSFTTSKASGTRIPLNVEKPVSCWDEAFHIGGHKIIVDLCVAPVLVCTEAAQTAGGGDNISSAGLVLQIWMTV